MNKFNQMVLLQLRSSVHNLSLRAALRGVATVLPQVSEHLGKGESLAGFSKDQDLKEGLQEGWPTSTPQAHLAYGFH